MATEFTASEKRLLKWALLYQLKRTNDKIINGGTGPIEREMLESRIEEINPVLDKVREMQTVN